MYQFQKHYTFQNNLKVLSFIVLERINQFAMNVIEEYQRDVEGIYYTDSIRSFIIADFLRSFNHLQKGTFMNGKLWNTL